MTKYISIGSICSVSFNLNKYNLRKSSLPFDWVKIDDIDKVSYLIDNKFDGFMDDLSIVKESDKFFIEDEKITHDKKKSLIVKNKYATFCHDFTDESYYEDEEKEKFNDKYMRRIERLYEILNSDDKIIFVRDEIKMNKINDEKINNFCKVIDKITGNYQVIIIIHNPKNKEIKYEKNEKITIINDTTKFGGWKRDNINWMDVFNL